MVPRPPPLVPAALALLATACGRVLELPPSPLNPPPLVREADPPHAWSESVVTLRGERLGTARAEVEVRFGDSSPVTPMRLEPDGSSLDVVVPADATAGPVSVTTPAGRGEAPFEYLGMGRLRDGRIALSRDLRARTRVMAPIPGEAKVLIALENQVGYLDSGGSFLPWDETWVPALFALTAHDRLLVTDPSSCEAPTCPPLLFWQMSLGAEQTEIPLPAPAGVTCPAEHLSLAGDADGARVIVGSRRCVWFVDVPTRKARVAVLPADAAPGAVWLGGARFLLVMASGFRLLDHAAGDAGTEWRPVTSEVSDNWIAAATPGERLLLVPSEGGVIHFFDLRAGGEPSRVRTLNAPFLSFVSDAVLFPSRLALLSDQDVVVYDLDTMLQLSRVALEWPTRPVAGSDGMLYVGYLGGVAIVSPESGALAVDLALRGRWHSPSPRRLPCGPAKVETDVVEVASRERGEILVLDARTLQPRTDCGGGPGLISDLLLALATAPGTNERFVLAATPNQRQARVGRFGPDGAQIGATLRVTDGGFPDAGQRWLTPTPDGSALVLRYLDADAEHAPAVEVLDLAKPWTAGHRGLKLPDAWAAVVDDAGRLAIAGEATLRGYDLAAARAGEARPLWADVALGEGLAGADTRLAHAGDRLFAITNQAAGPRLRTVSIATGQTLSESPLPELPLSRAVVAAPGGRRLWWLYRDPYRRTVELHGVRLDDEGRCAGSEPALPLPIRFGADALSYSWQPTMAVTPDGERLLVTGGDTDPFLLLR